SIAFRVFSIAPCLPGSTAFPYPPLFRSRAARVDPAHGDPSLEQHGRSAEADLDRRHFAQQSTVGVAQLHTDRAQIEIGLSTSAIDRKSTRLNSSHVKNSYAVFCLKKKTI